MNETTLEKLIVTKSNTIMKYGYYLKKKKLDKKSTTQSLKTSRTNSRKLTPMRTSCYRAIDNTLQGYVIHWVPRMGQAPSFEIRQRFRIIRSLDFIRLKRSSFCYETQEHKVRRQHKTINQ